MHFRQILIALPLLAPCAIAGGFDPHLVSAEAPWILHVDLEALSHSSLLSSLHEEGLFFENEFDLDRVKTEFGLDPFVDLGSITMYGVDARGDGVATVICGTEKLAAVWSQLAIKAPPTHVAGYDITQIGKGSEARCVTLLPARDGLPRQAVMATNPIALQRALAVLSKDAPSLASPAAQGASAPRIKATATAGSMVFAASAPGSRGPESVVFLARALGLLMEFANIDHHDGQIFAGLVRGLEFELKESHGELALRLAIDASTELEADQLEQILRAPILQLTKATDATQAARRLASLLEGLHIESPATRLSVNYRCDAARFVQDIRQLEKSNVAASKR